MASSPHAGSSSLKPTPILMMLRKHFLLWAIPTIAFCALSILYAVMGPKKFAATQTLLVRDQLIGGNYAKPGRFESMYSLKSAQESISEIAKNPTVIRKALQNAQLESSESKNANWPDDKTIEQYQGAISVSSPGGSEFGKSEMIDLVVKAGSRKDALALANSMTREIENQMREIRRQQAESMVQELSETVRLAEQDHELATDELKKMEASLGADLGELRSLNNPYSSTGSLQNQLTNVTTEIRSAINDFENLKKVQTLLRQAAMNSDAITAAPDEALTLLPALKNFKEGLVKAQLNLSKSLGQYSENHPRVIAAQTEVQEIQYRISNELKSSILAKEKEVEIAEAKVKRLQETSLELSRRLERLSLKRVEYDKLFTIVQQRSGALTKATQELNQMKSLREAAGKVDFVTRIDDAQVGTTPLGLSKRITVGLGTLFGLALGLGLVMFVAGGPMLAEPPSTTNLDDPNETPDPHPPTPPPAPGKSPTNRTAFRPVASKPPGSNLPDLPEPEPGRLDESFNRAKSSEPDSGTTVWNTVQPASEDQLNSDSPHAVADDSAPDDTRSEQERRRRERTNSRHESRPNFPSPEIESKATSSEPMRPPVTTPNWAPKSPIQIKSVVQPVPKSPAAPTTQSATETHEEVVIPQSAPPLEDNRNVEELLNDADVSSIIDGFDGQDLEDIDLESRGPLGAVKESDIIQGAGDDTFADEIRPTISTSPAQPTTNPIQTSASKPTLSSSNEPIGPIEPKRYQPPGSVKPAPNSSNVLTFSSQPNPLESPSAKPPRNESTSPKNETRHSGMKNQTTKAKTGESDQPLRLTPRKTTDPIPKAEQLFGDSKNQTVAKPESEPEVQSSPQKIPLPTKPESKVKPITQTLVLGSNSLLQMLEEQQKQKSNSAEESTTPASDARDPEANDSNESPPSVDRGSIFRFPSPESNDKK